MLIEALAPLLKAGQAHLRIVGDGPMRPELEKLATSLECTGSVEFSGWVQHADLSQVLKDRQIFGFPSVREFGGGAVIEAMAMGLVPVIADYAGPSELVDDSVGYKIAMGTRAELIQGFREKFIDLLNAPLELAAKSSAAINKAFTQYTWQAKARQIVGHYESLLEHEP